MILSELIFIILTSQLVLAEFFRNSDVVNLDQESFNRLVLESNNLWLINFYSQGCAHCKAFVNDYTKVASALRGIIYVGAVDAEQNAILLNSQQVNSFPNLKFYGITKNPEPYSGSRRTLDLISAAFVAARKKVDKQMEGRAKGHIPTAIELSKQNYATLVLQSDQMWMVVYVNPSFKGYKELLPVWEQAAAELKNKIKFGIYDMSFKSSLDVIIRIHTKNSAKEIVEFPGNTSFAAEIIDWGHQVYESYTPRPLLSELHDPSVLGRSCYEKVLCLISFLPQIYDCQAVCRNEYLSILRNLTEVHKLSKWGWIWSEAGAQPGLETLLGVGNFGYPTLAVVNFNKFKFAVLKGVFSIDGINTFLRELAYGREHTYDLSEQDPKIRSLTPWDGQDKSMPIVDKTEL